MRILRILIPNTAGSTLKPRRITNTDFKLWTLAICWKGKTHCVPPPARVAWACWPRAVPSSWACRPGSPACSSPYEISSCEQKQNKIMKIQYWVVDPRCLSWILIFFHPRSTKNKKRGGETIFSYLFCSHKFQKIEKYSIFEKEPKIWAWANWQRIKVFLTQKTVTKLSEIWVFNMVSGIRDPKKSSSQIQGSKKHRISDP